MEVATDIDAYLTEQTRRQRFSGSALVTRGLAPLLDRGYGLANRGERKPNTPQTAFQIASVSKQFTAAAILLLQEQGALSVRQRLACWVPAGPAGWDAITIHDLLVHTSGIGHWQNFPDLSLCEPTARERLIATFQRDPLLFPPGTRWSYSSPAYVLLAHIVEQVARQPYAAFVQDHIFAPLGMASTWAGNVPPWTVERAAGYSGGEQAPSFELDQVGIGAGDIWSTTGDLARWDAALAAPGFLRPDSLQAMFTPHARATWSKEGLTDIQYGYGWFLARLRGHRLRFHPGDNAGFQSFNGWFPDGDALVILLTNDDDGDLGRIRVDVASRVLNGESTEPAEP